MPGRSLILLFIILFSLNIAHAQEALLNNDYRNETCEMICLRDLEGYNLGIALLSAKLPGDSLMQVRYFYEHYIYDLPCQKNGTEGCLHEDLNFLQTAVMDGAELVVAYIITQAGYDLDRKLASGKSTIEWLTDKVNEGRGAGRSRREYYERILVFMQQQKSPALASSNSLFFAKSRKISYLCNPVKGMAL